MRRWIAVALTFVLGLLIGAAAGAAGSPQDQPNPPLILKVTPLGVIRTPSGSVPTTQELGLRVVRNHGNRVVATLMAKVDGRWREVELASQDILTGGR